MLPNTLQRHSESCGRKKRNLKTVVGPRRAGECSQTRYSGTAIDGIMPTLLTEKYKTKTANTQLLESYPSNKILSNVGWHCRSQCLCTRNSQTDRCRWLAISQPRVKHDAASSSVGNSCFWVWELRYVLIGTPS